MARGGATDSLPVNQLVGQVNQFMRPGGVATSSPGIGNSDILSAIQAVRAGMPGQGGNVHPSGGITNMGTNMWYPSPGQGAGGVTPLQGGPWQQYSGLPWQGGQPVPQGSPVLGGQQPRK